jgi:ArsR family transcriptional regulator
MSSRAAIPEWLLVRVAEQLRVLGQVARVRLIEELVDGPRTPQDLGESLTLSQQNVSKHLQVLYAVGVVTRRRHGARVLYALADDGIVELVDAVAARSSMALLEHSRATASRVHGQVSLGPAPVTKSGAGG